MYTKPFSIDETRAIAEQMAALDGPLLPILHAVQNTFGHVPEAAVPVIADVLNLSRAEVHGTVTFYHDFRRTPANGTIVKICRAEACQAMGARELIKHAEENTGSEAQIEAIYCLGLCATAPAAMVDGKIHARLDKSSLMSLIKDAS